MAPPRTVVFVCLHGSAKSLIAAEHFRRMAARQGVAVGATSAGIDPDPEIPSKVVNGLREDGFDVRGRQPQRLTSQHLAGAWRVVSFGCELDRRVPPGIGIERWDDVPPVSEDFTVARDAIVARLRKLLDTCQGLRGATP